MKEITDFNIDETNLTAAVLSRQYTVVGEEDAEFILQVFNSSTGASDLVNFYDFTTKSFVTEFTSKSSLKVKMKSNTFTGQILFPTNASGDTYTILLLTPPDKDTELTFSAAKNSYTTTITQVANTVLTFSPRVLVAGSFATLPDSITSTASPVGETNITKLIDWDIDTASTDAGGFGLRLIRQPIDTDWVFLKSQTVNIVLTDRKTDTVNGAVSSSTAVTLDTNYDTTGILVGDYVYGTGVTGGTTVAAVNVGDDAKDITLSAAMSISDGITLSFVTPSTSVVVDDLTNLATGMIINTVTGALNFLSGTPTVTAIDIDKKTLTLSTEQGFADGVALNFRALGSAVINKAIGADIDFSNWNSSVTSTTSAELTKVVRSTASSTTIPLKGSYGISGGGFVSVSGVNIVNTSANTVQTVTADDEGGGNAAVVMQVAQVVKAGSIVRFTGSAFSTTTSNKIVIKSHPSANHTINLAVDNFITPGISGS